MTMLDDRAAAEDAVQEAALKAWRARGRFRSEAPFKPWFLTIVANECRSARRSRWWGVLRVPEMLAERRSAVLDEHADLDAALDRLAPRPLLVVSVLCH